VGRLGAGPVVRWVGGSVGRNATGGVPYRGKSYGGCDIVEGKGCAD